MIESCDSPVRSNKDDALNKALLSGVLLLCQASGNAPQTSQAQTFDVVSIRPAPLSDQEGGFRRLDTGVMDIKGMSAADLIRNAFYLKRYQVVGGPEWLTRLRFDIKAKDTSLAQVDSKDMTPAVWTAAMNANDDRLRALLADRFRLLAHKETRPMQVYALVVATPSKLTQVPCDQSYYLRPGIAKGHMRLSSVIAELAIDLGRPVADSTGLSGCFDIDLAWTQDPDNDDLPSISGALQKLGLSLQKRPGTGEVLVIDRVEKPSYD